MSVSQIQLAVLATLVFTRPACGQRVQKLQTGADAIRVFAYQGKPIHPQCLSFPLEGQTRGLPIALAKCSASPAVPVAEGNDWLGADLAAPSRGHISYRVLARKVDRYFIATEVWGSGSGEYSALFWVVLDEKQIAHVMDEAGGDRCLGGVSSYVVEGETATYSVHATRADILALAGVKLDSATAERLRATPMSCDGEANYRYDLSGQKKELVSVTIHVTPEPNNGNSDFSLMLTDPRVCFDLAVGRMANAAGDVTLSPQDLKDFGRRFTAMFVARP